MQRVSVIVPTCNRGRLLKGCLEAIVAQTATDRIAEIIVVNDGGTRPDWLHDLSGADIRYIEQDNRGPAAARNAGARVATGDILVFLDDDCYPEMGWLESLLSVYTENPDADGAAGSLIVGRDASPIGYWEAQEFIPLFNKLNAIYGTSFQSHGRVWFHFGCNSSYRRSVFEDAGGYNENLRLMEDTDLQWRLFESGARIYYTPSAVVEHNGVRRFLGEMRRCYRCGIAYRNYCILHPGYRSLIAESSDGPNSLVRSVWVGIARAAGYTPAPGRKLYFMLLAFSHRFMYALGYLASKRMTVSVPTRVEPAGVAQCENERETVGTATASRG